MNRISTIVNIVAFIALFIAYAGGATTEKPSGVRRALQTYAGQLPTGVFPTVKPFWLAGLTTIGMA